MSFFDNLKERLKAAATDVENFLANINEKKTEEKVIEEKKVKDDEEDNDSEDEEEEEEEEDDDEEEEEEEEIEEDNEEDKFSKRISENLKNRGDIHKSIVLRGKVQSGKSRAMLLESIKLVSKGFSAVIVTLSQNAQVEQIMNRLIGTHGMNRKDVSVINCSNTFELTDEPSIYFSIGHIAQIKKMENLDNFVLFIDEADAQDTGSSQRAMYLSRLRNNAICTVFVSATPIDCVRRYGVRSRDVISIDIAGDYVGFGHKLFHIKETPKNCKYTGTKSGDIFKNDQGLKEFINQLSIKGPINDFLPQIVLVNNCFTNEPYEKVQDWMSVKYPDITTAVYIGDGIRARSKNIQSGGYDKTVSISSWLQKLKNQGGVKKHPVIMIFAGRMVGRGLSIVSDDFEWEITCMRYIVSTTQMKHPNLIQGAGRLCGNKKYTSFPRTLYTNVKKELMIVHNNIEEHMGYFDKPENADKKCSDGMQENTFNKNKKIRGSVVMDSKSSCPYKYVNSYRPDELTLEQTLGKPDDEEEEEELQIINVRLIEKPSRLKDFNILSDYLSKHPGWNRRGPARAACPEIGDMRDISTLQQKYSEIYEDGLKGILWRKVGKEYELKLKL